MPAEQAAEVLPVSHFRVEDQHKENKEQRKGGQMDAVRPPALEITAQRFHIFCVTNGKAPVFRHKYSTFVTIQALLSQKGGPGQDCFSERESGNTFAGAKQK